MYSGLILGLYFIIVLPCFAIYSIASISFQTIILIDQFLLGIHICPSFDVISQGVYNTASHILLPVRSILSLE